MQAQQTTKSEVAQSAPTFTAIDVTGAGTSSGLGTFATTINSAGAIAGTYADSSGVYHGFVRASNGTITTFDAPGAGTGANQGTCFFVLPSASLSNAGVIACPYVDSSGTTHGMVRAADGTITAFDPPGSFGTIPSGINTAGDIVGYYYDKAGAQNAFLRSHTHGNPITTIDVPGASDTAAASINASGEIAGGYLAPGSSGAFVRAANVTFVQTPGGGAGFSINKAGTVAGILSTKAGIEGLVISASGEVTSFAVAGSSETVSVAINTAGNITSWYKESSGISEGFERSASGLITTFSDPGATGQESGTLGQGINDQNAIAGTYFDSNSVAHGFLRKP